MDQTKNYLLEFNWRLISGYGVVKIWTDNGLFYLSQQGCIDEPVKIRCFENIPEIPDLSKPSKLEATERIGAFIVEINEHPEKYKRVYNDDVNQLQLF